MLSKDLITHKPSARTLMSMLADKPLPAACISDIPATSAISIDPVPHHHHGCKDCQITLACFEQDCTKTSDLCFDCATGERPAWSAREDVMRHRAKQAEEKRRQLIGLLIERLEGLTHLELVRVASFIEEVAGRR